MRARAVVVGAGVFGASLAWELVGRGWSVELVDQAAPGHAHASSGGASRLLRFAHGADDWYTASAWAARQHWIDLGEATGTELFVPSGVVWFAHRDDGWEAASEPTLRAAGIPVARLSGEATAALYPHLAIQDLAFALHEPAAGVLRAGLAVATLAGQAVARGAVLRRGRARPAGDAVLVEGERLEGDVVVWACGPWLATLFGPQAGLRVTQQDEAYFAAPAGWQAPGVPGWVDYDQAAYGLGDLDGDGFKCASDVEGPAFDPDTGERRAGEASLRRSREYLARRFPALADAPLAGWRVCQYELTADTHFLVDRHPQHERVLLFGGGSGHGFKHGPTMGAYLADVLEGSREPDPRFRAGSRVAGVGLRTAGR